MSEGKDKHKYDKIYQKKGIMTKKGGYVGKYGESDTLDKKWDRYGHAFEGSPCVEDILRLAPTSMIDIGAGFNEFIKTIRKRKGAKDDKINFIGIDIACPGADIIAPAHKLPFKNGRFDMLVSFDCMEHIPEEEVSLAIREFHRVAKRIYLKISLTHSPTLIDGERVHVCVKPKEWWLNTIQEYFPNASIRHHERKNTPWENIVIYGKK